MKINTTDFEFECLASFGPIDVEIHGNEIFVVYEELGEVMSAPLTPELISELYDIAEETSPYSDVRTSKAFTAIKETGARWRPYRNAVWHLYTFERLMDWHPEYRDECLSSATSFMAAFGRYHEETIEGWEPEWHLKEIPTPEEIEALRLRMLQLREKA
jgi:hypothetical protein